ncbi:MAG: hypothetical protein JNL80_15780 [Phycisphaerae bacterium]|jgi:V8-like Glu-specific endopeptidase|nr:hypothetical protein [Phycisphaerae bacterium]
MHKKIMPMSVMFAMAIASATSASAQQQQGQNNGDGRYPVVSADGEFLPAEMKRERPVPFTWNGPIPANARSLTLRSVNPIEVIEADLRAETCDTCGDNELRGKRARPRIGFTRSVEATLGRTARPETDFNVTRLADGRVLATLAVTSPGAKRIRLHFSDVDLGDCRMIVWAPHGDSYVVRGSYGGQGPAESGELWTASLPGDTAFVEIVGWTLPSCELVEVLHQDRDAETAGAAGEGQQGSSQGMNDGGVAGGALSCNKDATCSVTSSTQAAYDATGQMNFVENGNGYVCTGTMLTDQDPETYVPWFLTAYHCISTQSVVNTLEVVWFWQTASCNGSLPDYDALDRNTGGTLIATNPTDGGNDMCFIRLDGPPPDLGAFSGWTTALPALGRSFHHPAGSFKRYAEWDDVSVCIPCGFCADSSDYQFYNRTFGLCEGGSSGSGIFNSSGQLFGQLFGTCTDVIGNPDPTCSTLDDYWWYWGEFEETYPLISNKLIVGGTIWVNGAIPNGLPEIGSQTFPFNTLGEGYSAAFDGAQLKIVAGSYSGTYTFTKDIDIEAVNGVVTIGQ